MERTCRNTALSKADVGKNVTLLGWVSKRRNLGAIFRTALAVGVDGVVVPKKNSAKINATVEKASAGAINFLKIAVVSNVAQTIKVLKKEGVL